MSRPEGPDRTGGSSEPDEPPHWVVARAKELFHTTRLELAVLVFDPLVDADVDPGQHQLRFEHAEVTVELEVSSRPEGTRISGCVTGAGGKVVLHIQEGPPVGVVHTDRGSFAFSSVPHGLIRLSIEDRDPGPVVWTDWFRV